MLELRNRISHSEAEDISWMVQERPYRTWLQATEEYSIHVRVKPGSYDGPLLFRPRSRFPSDGFNCYERSWWDLARLDTKPYLESFSLNAGTFPYL